MHESGIFKQCLHSRKDHELPISGSKHRDSSNSKHPNFLRSKRNDSFHYISISPIQQKNNDSNKTKHPTTSYR